MKTRFTLIAAASALCVSTGLAAPAHAQRIKPADKKQATQQQAAQAAQAGPKRNFSKGALKALQELQTASDAGDTATFPAKLAAAQAAAKNADDRYAIANMQRNYAIKINDKAALRQAVDATIRSGGATPEELPGLYKGLGGLAYNAKDMPAALAAFQEVLRLQPNDTETFNNVLLIHREQKNHAQIMSVLDQRFAAAKAAGQKVDESLYRVALQAALDSKANGKIVPLTRDFIAAHPNPKNWQLALDLYRQSVEVDDATLVDTFRLMRTAKTLDTAQEYLALADALALGRFYSEARDVVNEGVAAGKFNASHPGASQILKEVSPKIAEDRSALAGLEGRAKADPKGTLSLRLADGFYGHGMYAKAAEFYRLAVQKGGVDANLANTRLGMSLALAGQRAEADTAFKAVTGPRSDLAGFWMLWLAQRA